MEEEVAAIQIMSLSFAFLLDSGGMSIKAMSKFLAALTSSQQRPGTLCNQEEGLEK